MVLGIGTAIVVTKSMTKTAANNCVCAWEHRESGKELKHDKWDDYIWKKIWLFRVLLANTECDPNPKVDGEEEEQREEVCRVCFKKPRITTDGSHLHDYGLEILGKVQRKKLHLVCHGHICVACAPFWTVQCASVVFMAWKPSHILTSMSALGTYQPTLNR